MMVMKEGIENVEKRRAELRRDLQESLILWDKHISSERPKTGRLRRSWNDGVQNTMKARELIADDFLDRCWLG